MWINDNTKQIFNLLYEIRQAAGDKSLPEHITDADIEPLGILPVLETKIPEFNPITQDYREVAPTKNNEGKWQRTYEVFDLSDDQVAANEQAKKDRIFKDVLDGTQRRLDDFAKTRGYDGILSLSTYATSPTAKFQAEGQYGVEARDATWAKLYEILAEVESGTRPMPEGYADIEPDVPELTWPN